MPMLIVAVLDYCVTPGAQSPVRVLPSGSLIGLTQGGADGLTRRS